MNSRPHVWRPVKFGIYQVWRASAPVPQLVVGARHSAGNDETTEVPSAIVAPERWERNECRHPKND